MNASQKSEALRLADKYEAHGFLGDHRFAKENWCSQAATELRRQHARIAELEAQLSAIGAGGVEPLRKSASMAASERELFEAVASDNGKWPKAIERDAKGNYLLLTTANGWMWWREARSLLAEVPAPAAQADARDAERRNGHWLTVVYRDIQPGDEVRTIVEHPKVSALSWSHALHDRDAAIAAQAKQGGQANG